MSSNDRAARRRAERDTGSVVIANISPGSIAACTAQSIASAYWRDAQQPASKRILTGPGTGTFFLQSGPRIAEARSQVIDHFLKAFPTAQGLLCVDSDMDFTYEDVRKLADHLDPRERPIVGGLCFAGAGPASMYPTVYSVTRDEEQDGRLEIDRVYDYPRNQLVKVAATGGAFTLIHRSVFTRMRRPYPNGFGTLPDGTPNSYPWYVEGHVDKHGRPFGEDIAFCLRAGALGMATYVDTSVSVGHRKSVILDEQLYDPEASRRHHESEEEGAA